MIRINFKANYLPGVRKFKVEVKTPERRWVELMTVARFIRFAREDGPVKIGGVDAIFSGPQGESCFQAVRRYFRQVADSYRKEFWK